MFIIEVKLGFSSLQIEDGEIYASINQKDGMVCFHDNPEKYNNPAMLHKIDQEVKNTFLLSVLSGFVPVYGSCINSFYQLCQFSPFRC